jgi:putative membrane protein
VYGAWHSVIAGFPILFMHLATTAALFAIGIVIYVVLTPYREIILIRDGNVAAAISLSGQMLALAIPLAAMMANSVSLADIVLWGVVTLVLQFTAFAAVAILIRHLPAAIERGEIAPALVLACGQIVAGSLIAAAMSG